MTSTQGGAPAPTGTGPAPGGSLHLLRAVFDESPVAILRAARTDDLVGAIVDANPAAGRLLGRTPAELIGSDLHAALEEGGPLHVEDTETRTEIRIRRGDDSTRWVAAVVRPLTHAAGVDMVVVALHDHTEQRSIQDHLDQAARHDPLTGLINRGEILRRLAAIDPVRDGPQVAVVFLDLDGFKLVNDTRGHQAGDELLVAVAGRIAHVVRPEDTVARLGGDEFVILCPRLAEAADARAIAERVRATLDQPVTVGDRSHRISMSLGIAASAADDLRPADLLRQADMAMYRAKDGGRNTIRYHSLDMDEALAAAEQTREDLTRALTGVGASGLAPAAGDGSSLILHFQPIIEIDTGRIAYVEALTRLRSTDGGLVYPSQYLPVAARAGLNGALSEWVLRAALRQREIWRAQGVDVPVGVNLARGQVYSGSFAGDALRIIAEEGESPGHVVFEMGEFGLLEATGPAQLTLRRLRASGIQLAIDHFGTGYSSLGALRFLGPHRVKIDRSFVASITHSDADRAIVTAAITAAHALGQRVVAEGVETSSQLAVLTELGCDEAQGFLVARVLPAEDLDLCRTRWEPGSLTIRT